MVLKQLQAESPALANVSKNDLRRWPCVGKLTIAEIEKWLLDNGYPGLRD
jgi:hypothetical protein